MVDLLGLSYKRGTDVFATNGDRLCQTIIRKDKAMIRGNY